MFSGVGLGGRAGVVSNIKHIDSIHFVMPSLVLHTVSFIYSVNAKGVDRLSVGTRYGNHVY